MTRAYKEKLAADKKWQQEEAAREAREKTAAKSGDATVSFYSNLLKGACDCIIDGVNSTERRGVGWCCLCSAAAAVEVGSWWCWSNSGA